MDGLFHNGDEDLNFEEQREWPPHDADDDFPKRLEACVRRVVARALRAEKGGSSLTRRIQREAEQLGHSPRTGGSRTEADVVALLSKRICRSLVARITGAGPAVPAHHGTRVWQFDTVFAASE